MTTLNAQLVFRAGGAPVTAIKEQGTSLFYVLKDGLIYQRTPTQGLLFLNINNRVFSSGLGETGLLGFTFHATNNQRFFLWYSETKENVPSGFSHINRLEEWRIVGGTPQRWATLLRLLNPAAVHNGSNNIYYDSELNRLMLATGDGGNSSFPQNNNQLHGKILSINVDDSIWQTNENDTPITQVSQLGAFSSVIEVVSKGIRNPTRLDQKDGIKFLSVAGLRTREFGFAFTTYDKNFGWRAFEGPLPALNGSGTVLFPAEVNQLLQSSEVWGSIIHYANASAVGLTPEIIRGRAMTGIDLYQGPISQLNNHLLVTELSGLMLQAPVPVTTAAIEDTLQVDQPVQRLTLTGLSGVFTTLYVTSSGRILVAHAETNSDGYLVSSVSELTVA